jgi:hypothetical protein
MTTVYIVKYNNKSQGYATADVFSTYELAQEFAYAYQSKGGAGVLEIVNYELDKPDYPFLKEAKPFILTFTNEDNVKYYIGVDKKVGNRDNAYLSTDRADAYEYEADTSKNTLLYNLEKYFNLVNLKVEEV